MVHIFLTQMKAQVLKESRRPKAVAFCAAQRLYKMLGEMSHLFFLRAFGASSGGFRSACPVALMCLKSADRLEKSSLHTPQVLPSGIGALKSTAFASHKRSSTCCLRLQTNILLSFSIDYNNIIIAIYFKLVV